MSNTLNNQELRKEITSLALQCLNGTLGDFVDVVMGIIEQRELEAYKKGYKAAVNMHKQYRPDQGNLERFSKSWEQELVNLFNSHLRSILDEARSKEPFKCEFGHEVYSHNTVDGWCCACEADQAFMEAEIENRVAKYLSGKETK